VYTRCFYKFVGGKTLENCYPEFFGNCDHKSDIKRDLKLHTTKDQILKTKKKTKNSGKLKTTRTVRTLKLLSRKKVLNKAAAAVSESTLQILVEHLNPHFFYNTRTVIMAFTQINFRSFVLL